MKVAMAVSFVSSLSTFRFSATSSFLYCPSRPPIAMASSLSSLSASVTRILYLVGFPKELKTKDIQAAFSDFDSGAGGGFKIKWRDDTSLLIVFNDPAVGE